MNSTQKDLAELRARFPVPDMGAERERITILDRLQESARVNAERMEGGAMTLGWHVVEQGLSGYGWVDVGRDPWPWFRTRRGAARRAARKNQGCPKGWRHVVRRET